MSIVKAEQHKIELDIFQCRHEAGAQALRAWLYARQAQINKEWIGLSGDDLARMQGEARTVAKMIRLIDVGPTLTEGGN